GLSRLLRRQTDAGALEVATATAMRLTAIDPLHEAAHRALMRLLLDQGRRAAALQQYQSCVQILQRELDAEPEEETQLLYREILRTAHPAPRPRPAAPTPTSPVGEAPLIGRAAELDRLRAMLAGMHDGGRTLLVSGEAGIGKSRLIGELTRLAAAGGAWL